MTAPLFALLAIAGGIGAGARLIVDGVVRARTRTRFPWATTVVNVSGSLVLGLLTGLAATGRLGPAWFAVIGSGFLGGYTTFSTASVETVRLLQEQRLAAALANGFGMLVVATLAALAGIAVGRAF